MRQLAIVMIVLLCGPLIVPVIVPVMGNDLNTECRNGTCGPSGCVVGRVADRFRGVVRPLVPVGTQNPAALRIRNQTDPMGAFWGSAVAVTWQGQQIVLSCAHLLSDGVGPVTVHTIDGRQSPARLVAVDTVYDLSVWRVSLPLDTVTIATVDPRPGDLVTQIGFGGDAYHAHVGRVIGYGMTPGSPGHRILEITGRARSGDSGGPMLNMAGELVAIEATTDGRLIRGTYCGQIIRFLNEHINPALVSEKVSPETPTAPLAPLEPPSDNTGAPEGSENTPAGPAAEQEPLVVATPPPTDQSTPSHAPLADVSRAASATIDSSGAWDTLLAIALPALIAGLGWTGPPAIALAVGAKALPPILREVRAWRVARRRRKGRAGRTADTFQRPAATGTMLRDTTEARQFLRLSQLEGRSPLHDALIGRLTFDELDNLIDAEPTGPHADWARTLRRKLDDRFNQMAPASVTTQQGS